MAIAGSVAPVFRDGGYDATATYDFYHAIIHNNKLYFCRQDGTIGHEPKEESDEYWFLSLDGNFADARTLEGHGASYFATDESVTNLINGTTPVGNALKLNGLTAEEVGASGARNLIPYPYLQSDRTLNGVTFTVDSDGVITAKGTATAGVSYWIVGYAEDTAIKLDPTKTYTVSNPNNLNSNYILSMRLYKEGDAFGTSGGTLRTLSTDKSSITFTGYSYVGMYIYVYSGVTVDVTFHPMLEIDSVAHDWVPYHFGGAEHALDADTVDGYHASELFQNHTARLTESATLKSLHSLVSADGAKVFHYVTSASGTLPSDFPTDLLTDGTVSSMFDVTVKRIGGNGYYTIEGVFSNGIPYKVEGYLSSVFYWRRVFTSAGGTVSGTIFANALRATRTVDNVTYEAMTAVAANGRAGLYHKTNDVNDAVLYVSPTELTYQSTVNNVATNYPVLHTGNSNAVIKATTALSDTTAVWVDTANKKVKAYIDGAWTALA